MKKNVLLLTIAFCIGVTSVLFAQKDRKLSNGFSISAVIGLPSDVFGYQKDAPVSSQDTYGSLWGFKLGNRWYFKPKENYGFGLMVNWIDFTFAYKLETPGDNAIRVAGDGTFLALGPIGTYAVSKTIALDAYYNLRPTAFTNMIDPANGDQYGYSGFGISNAFGGAFRYKALNLGFEYVFGGINTSYYDSDFNIVSSLNKKLMINSFRFLLGLKL